MANRKTSIDKKTKAMSKRRKLTRMGDADKERGAQHNGRLDIIQKKRWQKAHRYLQIRVVEIRSIFRQIQFSYA